MIRGLSDAPSVYVPARPTLAVQWLALPLSDQVVVSPLMRLLGPTITRSRRRSRVTLPSLVVKVPFSAVTGTVPFGATKKTSGLRKRSWASASEAEARIKATAMMVGRSGRVGIGWRSGGGTPIRHETRKKQILLRLPLSRRAGQSFNTSILALFLVSQST